eukprot:3218668-Pleurochrysis_carterae.AAC.1
MKAFAYVDGNMFAPYSRYQAEKRGLPFSYGQFVATQLVATALRTNLGVPTVRYDDARAQPELAEVLQRWAREG